jgi:predicted DNA-binding WGR domain protein
MQNFKEDDNAIEKKKIRKNKQKNHMGYNEGVRLYLSTLDKV